MYLCFSCPKFPRLNLENNSFLSVSSLFEHKTNKYEGRSESSNNCLIIHIIFIVKQKEANLFKLQHVLYKCCENQDDALRHIKKYVHYKKVRYGYPEHANVK